MQRRTMMMVVIGTLMLGTMACMVSALLVYLASGVNDSGSPELAAEWKARLEPLTLSTSDPRKEHPSLEIVHFPNGEWVMGFARNSHGLFVGGGGTLVVKDSRGNIRSYFGHVCGPHYLQTFFHETPDLDSFHDRLTKWKFIEHIFP